MKIKQFFINWQRPFVVILLVLQLIIATLFVADLFSSLIAFGDPFITWENRERLHGLVALNLLVSPFVLWIQYCKLTTETHQIDKDLLSETDPTMRSINQEFGKWGLTPSECRVATYVLKGMSNAEIAALNGTKEGTVKAQCNALFRKSNTKNRSQFNSYFFEVLTTEQGVIVKSGV